MSTSAPNPADMAKVGLDAAKFAVAVLDGHKPSDVLRVVNATHHKKITVRSYCTPATTP